VDRTVVCHVEHGPDLPLRVQADVEGPEVAIAQVRPCSIPTRSDPLYHEKLMGQIAPKPRFFKMVDLRDY